MGSIAIGSREALIRRAEDISRATGKSQDEAAAVVVDDLESAAAALTTRTAPLVPSIGVLVALSGITVKAEPTKNGLAEAFVSLALLFAVVGFAFVTTGLFLYAGRRTVGVSPTVDDIGFARDRLVRRFKLSNRGSVVAGMGLLWLIIGILAGIHIRVN
ncbi:MAG TPA: hypothetical protein VGH93_12160 [Solirubrobacteraceae bacterium]